MAAVVRSPYELEKYGVKGDGRTGGGRTDEQGRLYAPSYGIRIPNGSDSFQMLPITALEHGVLTPPPLRGRLGGGSGQGIPDDVFLCLFFSDKNCPNH
jgi:hypothetical protein